MRGRLAILGAGGHGKVVAEAAELIGWCDIVFFDDAVGKCRLTEWEVIGDTAALTTMCPSLPVSSSPLGKKFG